MKKLIVAFVVFSLLVMGYMYKSNKDKESEKQKIKNIELIILLRGTELALRSPQEK